MSSKRVSADLHKIGCNGFLLVSVWESSTVGKLLEQGGAKIHCLNRRPLQDTRADKVGFAEHFAFRVRKF